MAPPEDPHFDSDTAADLLKLNRILEYCDPATVGSHALRRSPSVRSIYVQALSRMDRIALVFDERLYEDSVLMSHESEKAAYDALVKQAKASGVPESQLPPPKPREKPRPPVDSVLSTVIPEDGDAVSRTEPPTPALGSLERVSSEERPHTSPKTSPGSLPLPRTSMSLSTHDKVLRGIAALFPSQNAVSRITRLSDSASSFSGISQTSTASTKRHHVRRDSIMQYFRRAHHRKGSSSTSFRSPRSFSRMSRRTEADSISSEDPHGQDSVHSTYQTPPTSIRSSTSSTIDVQFLSFRERAALQEPMRSQRFQDLQQKCQREAQRFASFADQQHVALPLIFGRNRLYMAERRESDIMKLQQKHEVAIEALENRHLEQELTETERLKLEKEESATRNATALKHVHRRISLLGNEATEEQLKRFEEEANAMDRLEKRHKREMDGLLRMQKRERLILQREQEKELADFRKKMKQEFDEASKIKSNELERNMRKLDDTIRERKSRLTMKWYLELQIFKQETAELKDSFIGPLPLRILGSPAELSLDGGHP